MRGWGFLFVAIALLAPALPGPAGASHVGGLYGGDLRVALEGSVSLDPIAFAENRIVQELVYESLVRTGMDQRAVRSLASAWSADVPGGTMTVDLRAAQWEDGAPITAHDVAWSFLQHLTGGTADGLSAAALDGDTVRFSFTFGGGDFLGSAATLPIAWKDQSTIPAYAGPYVVSAESASALDLAANPLYWAGRPYVDTVSFRFPYTLDTNVDGSTAGNDAACALMKGDIHLIGWPVTSIELNTERDCVATYGGWSDGLNRTLADPYRRVPHVGAADNPAFRFLTLGMNVRRPALTETSLRLAISRAVDRDLIADLIEPGTDIADSPISPANVAWFNPDVPRNRVPRVIIGGLAVPTLERVNAFLTEAGYLDTDGDGWRESPGGAPLSLTLATPDLAADPRSGKYDDTHAKLRAIGLNVTRVGYSLTNLSAIVQAGSFDLFMDQVGARGEPSFLFDLYHRDGGDNVAGIDDPALNAILEIARDALDDGARLQAVFDAQMWIAEHAVGAPIIHLRALHSYDRVAFEGWVQGLEGIVNFWTFTSVRTTQRGPLFVTVDPLRDSLRSGASTTLVVAVRDAADDPVEGVELEFDGAGLSTTVGTTPSNGTFFLYFVAPTVAVSTEFPITVLASKAGYDIGNATQTLAVHPLVRTFSLALFAESTTMASGDRTVVRVTVFDEFLRIGAAGVNVEFAVSPAGLGASFAQPSGVTDANGAFETTFTADVTVASRFLVLVTVSKPGYEITGATRSIEVSSRPASGAPSTPALDTLSMVVIVAGLAAVFGWQQRRRWITRKP